MSDLCYLCRNTDVTVLVRAISLSPPETVTNKDGKKIWKQDCIVGDASGCCRLVLWEKDVATLLVGKSYKL